MTFRDSHASYKDKLVFVLFGGGWSIHLNVMTSGEYETDFDLEIKGTIEGPNNKEYAHVWINSCADITIKKLKLKDNGLTHESFNYAMDIALGDIECD